MSRVSTGIYIDCSNLNSIDVDDIEVAEMIQGIVRLNGNYDIQFMFKRLNSFCINDDTPGQECLIYDIIDPRMIALEEGAFYIGDHRSGEFDYHMRNTMTQLEELSLGEPKLAVSRATDIISFGTKKQKRDIMIGRKNPITGGYNKRKFR